MIKIQKADLVACESKILDVIKVKPALIVIGVQFGSVGALFTLVWI